MVLVSADDVGACTVAVDVTERRDGTAGGSAGCCSERLTATLRSVPAAPSVGCAGCSGGGDAGGTGNKSVEP